MAGPRVSLLVVLGAFAVLAPSASLFAVDKLPLPKRDPVVLQPIAHLEGPAGSKEVSGIVRSRQWPGVYWVHNDSGDETRVYPVTLDGKLFRSARAADSPGVLVGGVINSDWEAVAVDASGHIIIADVGNNSNGRRDLALHYIVEPEPTVGFTGVLKSVFVRYPEQKSWPAAKEGFNYDCEGVFTRGDTVYFVTKRRSDTLTRLYRLDAAKPGMVNDLTPLGYFDVQGRATAADATDDGHRLAVLTYTGIWVFEPATRGGDDWFDGAVYWMPFTQAPGAEGICWENNDTLIVAAEEGAGKLYRVTLSELTRVR